MIKQRAVFNEIEPYLESQEAIVITGMRRTGKTTAMNYFFDRIASSNKVFLDLENPINIKYFEEINYERIKSSFEILEIDFSKRPYIFLDEIQFAANIPSVIKYFIDHYNAKFFVTGSANFYLKNLFSESLSGRKYIFEIFPLTFKEFLWFKDSPLTPPVNTRNVSESIFETFSHLFDEYLEFGGFPGVVLKTDAREKKKALEDIFTSFFQLEVLQLGDYRRNNVIRDLMLLLMQRIGSKLDIKKLSIELGVSRPTLYEYITFLEDTYFMKRIRPFSKSRNSELRKIPKVYVCDSGLANHFGKLSEGSLFENQIYHILRMRGEINYYQKKSGPEVDFILNKKEAIEVKLNPTKKDLKKLRNIASELSLEGFKIISKNYSELENVEYGFMV